MRSTDPNSHDTRRTAQLSYLLLRPGNKKPFAKVAVDGIRKVIDQAGYELVLLEKYETKAQLLKAVEDVNAVIIRNDVIEIGRAHV